MLASGALSFILTCLAAAVCFGQKLSVGGALLSGTALLLALAGLQFVCRAGLQRRETAIIASCWGLFGGINAAFQLVALQKYGDYGVLESFIANHKTFPRWLSGTRLLSAIYSAVGATDSAFFVAVLGVCVLLGCTLIALHWSNYSLACCTAVLSPIYFMFLSGYSEYYPFIAGPLLLLLVWMVKNSEKRVSPLLLGLLCAAFASLYFGYFPLAVALVLLVGKQSTTDRLLGLAAFVLLVGLAIPILWPAGWQSFLTALSVEIDPSGMNIIPSYRLHRWHSSFLFEPDFLLSPLHVAHKLYIFFFSGMATLLALAGVHWQTLNTTHGWMRDPTFKGLLLLALMEIGYFLLAIPYFGPRRDIDLFFQTGVVLGFFFGHVIERSAPPNDLPKIRGRSLGLLLGSGLALIWFLLFLGIPRPSRGLLRLLLNGFSFN
ncbi:MAG: hypothetical protein K1X83_01355 [Oligoflexia bacterium]|nr:hypothetical protein [Oligoflexia bacterium]